MSIKHPKDLGLTECKGCDRLVDVSVVNDYGFGPCCFTTEEISDYGEGDEEERRE